MRDVAAARAVDALVLACVAGGLAWLAYGAATRLHYQWNWAVIPQFLVQVDPVDGSLRAGRLLLGLATTIRLSVYSGLLALGIGLAAGLMRVSTARPARLCAGAYVLAVPNTPPLVLIFLFSYFLSGQLLAFMGLDLALARPPASLVPLSQFLAGPVEQLPGFLIGVATLGLIEGAYVAEIVRAGVQGVETGQWDAARALGFPRWRALAHVILPQALRGMTPALTGQFVSTIKDSAIVSVISVPELTFQAQELVGVTYRSFEVWTLVFALYLALGLPCSLAARALEARLARAHLVPAQQRGAGARL